MVQTEGRAKIKKKGKTGQNVEEIVVILRLEGLWAFETAAIKTGVWGFVGCFGFFLDSASGTS